MRDQYDGPHSAQRTAYASRAVSLTVNRNDKFLVAAKQHLDIVETPETMKHLALGYCDSSHAVCEVLADLQSHRAE